MLRLFETLLPGCSLQISDPRMSISVKDAHKRTYRLMETVLCRHCEGASWPVRTTVADEGHAAA